jgi:hypothetical protein
VKVGDLVVCTKAYAGAPHGQPVLLVDIDPLRKPHPPAFPPGYKINEIVVLLPGGRRWHAAPADWEVVSESR